MYWLLYLSVLLVFLTENHAQWTLVSENGAPGYRTGSPASYCENRDSMILSGGITSDTSSLTFYASDIWEFSFSTFSWKILSNSGLGSGNAFFGLSALQSSIPNSCRLIMFGGETQSSSSNVVYNNQLTYLTLSGTSSLSVQPITTLNSGPSPRSMFGIVTRRQNIVIFGGFYQANLNHFYDYDDLWEFIPGTPNDTTLLNSSWLQYPKNQAQWTTARSSFGMALKEGDIPSEDFLYIYGGETISGSSSSVLADLSIYSFATNTWTVASGLQLYRMNHGMVYANNALYTFGGDFPLSESETTIYEDFIFANISNSTLPVCQVQGLVDLWCLIQPPSNEFSPIGRYAYSYILRKELFVIYGGRIDTFFQDFWFANLSEPVPYILDEIQFYYGPGGFTNTVYFMIAVLAMMVICFSIFIISLRRQRQVRSTFLIANQFQASRQRGVSPQIIQSLPLKVYNKPAQSAEGDQEQDEDDIHNICAICLTDYESGEYIRILPCGHFFHPKCVDVWLETRNACPMCKSAVDTNEPAEEEEEASEVPTQEIQPAVGDPGTSRI